MLAHVPCLVAVCQRELKSWLISHFPSPLSFLSSLSSRLELNPPIVARGSVRAPKLPQRAQPGRQTYLGAF